MPNPRMGLLLSDVPVRTIEREEPRQKLAAGCAAPTDEEGGGLEIARRRYERAPGEGS